MATQRMRCLKCLKIIECAPYDPEVLLNHIRTDHPEVLLTDNETMPSQASEHKQYSKDISLENEQVDEELVGDHLSEAEIKQAETETAHRPDVKALYTRKYKVRTPLTPRSPQKRRKYRTSIEKWQAASGSIYCPKCGAFKRPIIRSRSERLSNSSAGAACILICWPMWFLSHLFSEPSKNYLYCAGCHNFLGMYDKQRNCVRPNVKFVDGEECQCQPFENQFEINGREDQRQSF